MNKSSKYYHIIACNVFWREICKEAANSKNKFTFSFIKQRLHDRPEKLKEILKEEIQKAQDPGLFSEPPNAILLSYGLCSNSISGLTTPNIPLIIPRSHDCIAILLGSQKKYNKLFQENPGTYWLSSGWIDSGAPTTPKQLALRKKELIKKYGLDNAKYLFQTETSWINEYTTCAFINNNPNCESKYIKKAKLSATDFDWNFIEQEGTTDIIHSLLSGEWPKEKYLTVNPGEKIVPTGDDTIIKTIPL